MTFLVVTACAGEATEPESTTTTPPPGSTTTSTTTTVVTTTEPLQTPTAPVVEVTGPEELVWDWTNDRCEDENIPDIASRAFRDAEGQVNLIIGHYVNYRMVGPSLDEVETDCSAPIMSSDYDPDPSQFNDSEWLTGPYTFDGETIYSLVHNEYRGDTHDAVRPDQCPSSDRYTCLDTSITMAISTDGGATFTDMVAPPGHLIATLPYTFDDEGVPSGLRQASNIIEGPDGFYYNFSNVSDYPNEAQWVCAMRTDDLSDPSSWRFWDGSAFDGVFVDPYVDPVDAETEKCAPLDPEALAVSVQESVVYDTVLERYVMFGTAVSPTPGYQQFGVYYSFSEDLIDWTTREFLLDLPSFTTRAAYETSEFYAYISVIDPDSESMSFETTDGSAYLYMTKFNAGTYSLDRDLVRYPIELRLDEVPPPSWEFETDGDTEGWSELHGVAPLETRGGSLVVESVADDPYITTGPVNSPSQYSTLTIEMTVSGSGETVPGQVFFAPEADPIHTEPNSITFDVIADGAPHEYVLDMSSVPGWEGTIVDLRLDPVPDAGRTITIDSVSLGR